MRAFTYEVCSNLGGFKSLQCRGGGGGVGAMLASAKKFDQKQKFEIKNAVPKKSVVLIWSYIEDGANIGQFLDPCIVFTCPLLVNPHGRLHCFRLLYFYPTRISNL